MKIVNRLDRFTGKRVNEITSDDLRDFILQGGIKQPSPSAISSYRSAIRAFFGWAAYAGIISHDPSAVLTRTVRVRAKPVRTDIWLSEDEINALFAACYDDEHELLGRRDAVAIGLMVLCGLRVNELACLRWQNVHLRRGMLDFMGKGAKPAQVRMPAQLVEMLFEWRGLLAAGGHFEIRYGRGTAKPEQRAVLLRFRAQTFDGRELEPCWGCGLGHSGIRDLVAARGAQIGVPGLRPHDLRRSFAGLLEEKGVSIREISLALRHESVATTERYLADNPAKWQDNVAAAVIDIKTRRVQ